MEKITTHADEWMNKIITIKCSGVTQNAEGFYSLLHPRIASKMYRDDKTVADSLEDILNIERMAKGLK